MPQHHRSWWRSPPSEQTRALAWRHIHHPPTVSAPPLRWRHTPHGGCPRPTAAAPALQRLPPPQPSYLRPTAAATVRPRYLQLAPTLLCSDPPRCSFPNAGYVNPHCFWRRHPHRRPPLPLPARFCAVTVVPMVATVVAERRRCPCPAAISATGVSTHWWVPTSSIACLPPTNARTDSRRMHVCQWLLAGCSPFLRVCSSGFFSFVRLWPDSCTATSPSASQLLAGRSFFLDWRGVLRRRSSHGVSGPGG